MMKYSSKPLFQHAIAISQPKMRAAIEAKKVLNANISLYLN